MLCSTFLHYNVPSSLHYNACANTHIAPLTYPLLWAPHYNSELHYNVEQHYNVCAHHEPCTLSPPKPHYNGHAVPLGSACTAPHTCPSWALPQLSSWIVYVLRIQYYWDWTVVAMPIDIMQETKHYVHKPSSYFFTTGMTSMSHWGLAGAN